jgi:hypothetical protein
MNRLQTIIVVKHLHAVLPTLAAFSGVRVPPDPTAQSATRISESTRGKLGVPLGSWNRKFSVRTGKFTFVGAVKRGATKGVSSNGCVGNMGLSLAPQVGLEPTTLRLTAECSTIELLRSNTGGLSSLDQSVL